MYLLGIDVGTTGTKSVIFDQSGRLVAKGYVEYPVSTPASGWAEQDPMTWWSATIESLKEAISKSSASTSNIACVGLSGQTNSPSFIDGEGNPLRPCIIWMDGRADPQSAQIRRRIGEERVYKTTGVKVDPFYSYCKIMWVKENQPEIYDKTKVILQPKDFIGFKLTGEHFLDKALASSSGLLDTMKGRYATKLLEDVGLDVEKLPKLVLSTDMVGNVTSKAADLTGLTKGTPVIAGSGDVMVNAVGCGAVKPGRAYNKTATASDLVVCVDRPVFDSKFRMVSYAHTLPGMWLLVGGAGGGVCYRWFRDKFSQLEINLAKSLNKNPYEIIDEGAEQVGPGSENLIFLPYLMGARSPIWDTRARGVYFGIGINHDRRHFARAIMEGIAYSVRHRMEIMEKELGVKIDEVTVVGGGARSALWRRIMADVYNKPIAFPSGEEQECLGAVILAGLGIGLYRDAVQAGDELVSIVDRLRPKKENLEKYSKLFKIYVDLYDQLKDSFQALAE